MGWGRGMLASLAVARLSLRKLATHQRGREGTLGDDHVARREDALDERLPN